MTCKSFTIIIINYLCIAWNTYTLAWLCCTPVNDNLVQGEMQLDSTNYVPPSLGDVFPLIF